MISPGSSAQSSEEGSEDYTGTDDELPTTEEDTVDEGISGSESETNESVDESQIRMDDEHSSEVGEEDAAPQSPASGSQTSESSEGVCSRAPAMECETWEEHVRKHGENHGRSTCLFLATTRYVVGTPGAFAPRSFRFSCFCKTCP